MLDPQLRRSYLAHKLPVDFADTCQVASKLQVANCTQVPFSNQEAVRTFVDRQVADYIQLVKVVERREGLI